MHADNALRCKQQSPKQVPPDILQAAPPGHLSTSVGQTAQNQAEQTLGLRETTGRL